MAFGLEDVPDQHGRTAVVTGGNSGIGMAVATALAHAGAHVVIAARDADRSRHAAHQIRSAAPGSDVDIVAIDLASLTSVDQAATTIVASHPRIDLLINNAGVMATPRTETVDGFELQFATNHLGHFALTAHLLGAVLRAPAARVVSVTSTGRHLGRRVDRRDVHMTRRYGPWRSYGRAKLANVHFAVELDRRLRARRARAISLVAHPGLSPTNLQETSVRASGDGRSQRFFHWLAATTGMPAARAALSLLRAATDPDARGGSLYAPRYINSGPPVRRPLMGRSIARGPAESLWAISASLTGVDMALEPDNEA